MIEFRDVTFAYSADSPGPALTGVSFALEPGETLAVLGRNGSGKSTLARLCDGLLLPADGQVLVDGMDTRDERLTWDVRARVGLVFQNPDNQIVGTSVEEDAAFGPENLGVPRDEIRRRVDEALAAVGLAGLERREPHTLSEGQKQRLALAGVLALRPSYIVADEPTALLDPASRSAVGAILRTAAAVGTGVLHISHDVAEAVAADRVLVLDRGRIAFLGGAEELFADRGLLSDLGLPVPPLVALSAALRNRHVHVPLLPEDPESVVEALWP